MRCVRSMILAGLVLAGSGHADEKQFVERWTGHDEQIMVHGDFVRYYAKKQEMNFIELDEYPGPVAIPPGSARETESALVLYADRDITLLLVTPKNIMKNVTVLNEEYRRTRTACANDRSWIVSLPENRWTEVGLNPYCAMNYREDQITVDLYWTEQPGPPLIDITTSGLTCIPHSLYGWDGSIHKYSLKSTKCTGARDREHYRTGPALRQIFPETAP